MVIFGLLTRYFIYAYFTLFCVFRNEMHIIAYYGCVSRYFFMGHTNMIILIIFTNVASLLSTYIIQSDVVLDLHTHIISFVR